MRADNPASVDLVAAARRALEAWVAEDDEGLDAAMVELGRVLDEPARRGRVVGVWPAMRFADEDDQMK